jgi:hypothetical protein
MQEALAALLQVIMIDLTLAGDNAIVIGLAAAGLPVVDRAHGLSGQLHRRRAATTSLDRLRWSCCHSVCSLRDDLPWRS